MAPVKIEVGDFMEYKNKTCLIVEVHNTIHVGYTCNTYSLLNLETGINTAYFERMGWLLATLATRLLRARYSPSIFRTSSLLSLTNGGVVKT